MSCIEWNHAVRLAKSLLVFAAANVLWVTMNKAVALPYLNTTPAPTKTTYELPHDVVHDYRYFYSPDNLFHLMVPLSLAALMANTSTDKSIRHYYQHQIRNKTTDRWSEIFRHFGTNSSLYVYTGIGVVGYMWRGGKPLVMKWGMKNLRAFIVGGPVMFTLQKALGSHRPEHQPLDSKWHFFHSRHGVSGHSFIGAIPFLSAASMTHRPIIKGIWCFASILPSLSRLNHDLHFPSQVFLGWSLAYLSVQSVTASQQDSTIAPWMGQHGVGFMWHKRFD